MKLFKNPKLVLAAIVAVFSLTLLALAPVPALAATGGNCSTIDKCDFVDKYVEPAIQLLSAAVGVIVVISIIIGGIQYAQSSGDPQKAAAAIARIRNAVLALVVFIFLYSMLEFLLPGGLF